MSQFIGMIITLILLKKRIRPYALEYHFQGLQLAKIKEILLISVPTIIQQSMMSLSAIFLMSLVNPYGSEIISGYLAVNKIFLFGLLAVIGICQALSVFTAYNSGAGQILRIREGYICNFPA